MKKSKLEKVEKLLKEGKLQEAKVLCRRECTKHKTMHEAWHLMGIINNELGSHSDAEQCFRQVTALLSKSADAYFNLGKCLDTQGKLEEAEKNYLKASQLNPNSALTFIHLGLTQAKLHKLEEAESNLQCSLKIQPDNANFYHIIGIFYSQHGKYLEAERAFLAALELQPNFINVLEKLARFYSQAERLDDAEPIYRRIIQLAPTNVSALYGLSWILFLHNNYMDAVNYCTNAVKLDPTQVESHVLLGAIKQKQGKFTEALNSYQKAINLNPQNQNAHRNIGIVLCKLGRYEESINASKAAISIDNKIPGPYLNMANALAELGHLQKAINALRQSLIHSPDYEEAYSALGRILSLQGKIDEAFTCYKKALEINPELTSAQNGILPNLIYSNQFSRQEIYEAHRQWGLAQETNAIQRIDLNNNSDPDKRLRIGYTSPDFRNHSVAFFFEPLLENKNSSAFEIFCYSDVEKPDNTTEQLKNLSHHWRNCFSLSDEAVAKLIRDDQIDILIDLAGHTEDNRLKVFSKRVAPVQVSYLGYPNTTGLSEMDYLVSDRFLDPDDESEKYYTEKLLYLPNSFFCYKAPSICPDIVSAPVIQNDYVTFGSYNKLTKISDEVIALWSQVLQAVPNSRLIFQCLSLNDPPTRERYEKLFLANHISLERIDFISSSSFSDYLAGHANVDIVLDTFPWNGHTVSCHALWMGVPVVTLALDKRSSRMGLSILKTLGLDSCIAFNKEQYVNCARQLAEDRPQLETIRKNLRVRMRSSALCNGKQFTQDFETQLRSIWQTWCENKRE